MKKYLFLAATAFVFAACTNEELTSPDTGLAEVAEKAVGFDVYVPGATNTRAGLEGTMTTDRLKRSEAYGGGFGVYAYQVQDAEAAAGYGANATAYNPADPGTPNFMVNEKLLWNSVNQGWYYNPLKYWPNETDNDSQASQATMVGDGTNNHIDRLSFFAYAPYVSQASADYAKPGIVYVTNNNGYLSSSTTGSNVGSAGEARIAYAAATTNPDQAVDLLWGVAPAGGLTYTAVNGYTINVNEGLPLVDMTKPDVNTNMKFLFQHALARIGVKAVAAVDQVSPGGKLDPNTKITIEKITLTGYFGKTGILNLDNKKASIANWETIDYVDLTSKTAATTVADIFGSPTTALTLAADHSTPADGSIATHLQFVGDVAASLTGPAKQTDRLGVTTVKQDVIQPAKATSTAGNAHCVSTIVASAEKPLYYSETTPYYTTWTKDAGVSGDATATVYAGSYWYYGQDGSWTLKSISNKDYTYPMVVEEYIETLETGATAAFTAIGDDATLAKKYAEYTAYVKDGSKYTPVADIPEVGKGHYVLTATMDKVKPAFANGTYYKRDANYFMVVPTNNIANICTALTPEEQVKLRTIRVKIEYYITTEDDKLAKGRAQTKNVIEKDVVFPSLANGKSYNLNMILGLTSVKMEAEVDDWKVINVQADLPQNTAE